MNILSIIILIIVSISCLFFGSDINIASQIPLYQSLRDTSAIIFGVTGVWIAILYPKSLQKIYGKSDIDEASKEYRNIKQLCLPLKISTIIVSLVLIIGILNQIGRQFIFLHQYKDIVRSFSFSLLGSLTYLQLWALIAALSPNESFLYKIQRSLKIREFKSKIFPKNHDH
jgi:ABC-type polysaccharide transport system permease subunit